MTAYTSTFPTPFGPFSVAVSETGAVLATAFGNLDALRDRFDADTVIDDSKRTQAARDQISAYLAGKRTDFDLPLAPEGSAFQQRVWSALRSIPRGETRSYGYLAKKLRTAARAIGRANATNPICLIVPCHRVIGADGSLTGFAFGEEIKRRLLELEGLKIV
ncbi:cysteine methyltransferase [Nibricoccus aquaticus]|uniref:Methylated-DNA--protein-cysteine methyltransferase n=1 Tax=Nibricoccus aquaticus TaxID=2576891 RepID=A0A290Q3L2_9BACT|nr:methylated-DNA--[protein]-cysteine S-methyltransferase [Nibricoccus aquaticus]ATC63023.1 cysteine methyltransferase [Nibricoccus aquaticus]